MDGLLLIDKPIGWTSFDVVAKIRGTLKASGIHKPKVGHTGTLDPLATGLLIIVVGSYCKRAQEFSKLDKTYAAEITLGATSTTDDGEGEKIPVSDGQPPLEVIKDVVSSFLGQQQQRPPAFSAIKVGGQRAYDLARKGKAPVMELRTVTVKAITNVTYTYPKLLVEFDVTSGTYIRSLARDIGESLKTGAYLSALRRLTVGEFSIVDATSIEGITAEVIHTALRTL